MWQSLLNETISLSQQALDKYQLQLKIEEVGTVTYLGGGVARAKGLPNVGAEELVRFSGSCHGMAYNLDRDEVGIILLNSSGGLKAGCEVLRTARVLDTPVGEELLGRVIDATGRPLDNLGVINTSQSLPVEREAPGIMQRAPVTVPLQTGIKVIDALIPIGRGQRELILGDRATGKTAIALDTILNQKGKDVICIYCAIGQRSSAVAKLIAELRQR
ncbi:MAG: F0F1 ATP synthase subunit alpha, partial [Cyanobacteria bacterium P01_A01_bin.83]